MTMYRLWVITLNGQRLIYSRHFPHLEKRDNFNFPSVGANEFLKTIFASLGLEFAQSLPASYTTSISTISNVDGYDYSKMSRSSSSSGSLNSLISTSTSASRATKAVGDASDSPMSPDFSVLHNYLPLIVCRFMNNPHDNNAIAMDEHQKLAYMDLIMLVYEKNGYLFVCCPRLITHSSFSSVDLDNYYEQLILEEQNISLSYSALQLISATFFAQNKSIKHLEVFISSCMPFGTLIKNEVGLKRAMLLLPSERRSDKVIINSNNSGNEGLIRLCINEFVSTSFQTFSRSTAKENETLFGTLTVECAALSTNHLSKADVKLLVDNLSTFRHAKPANCDLPNSGTLNFDLKHSKLDPFNILHYRQYSAEEEAKHPPSSPGLESLQNRKIFTYRYTIGSKSLNSNSTKSLISSRNCQHITIVISFNSRLPLDDIKFAYFMVKFSLNQGKSKTETVQTADSSVTNLIVRESIKASFGQVRSESTNFIWVIGQKVPKSGKLSLEFDLLIDEEKLANLETVCNFRFDHKVAFKLAHLKKMASLLENNISQAKIASLSSEEFEEIRECHLRSAAKLIEPHLAISKVLLHTELDRAHLLGALSDRRQAEQKASSLVMLEYRLSSFEYRLLPDTTHRPTIHRL